MDKQAAIERDKAFKAFEELKGSKADVEYPIDKKRAFGFEVDEGSASVDGFPLDIVLESFVDGELVRMKYRQAAWLDSGNDLEGELGYLKGGTIKRSVKLPVLGEAETYPVQLLCDIHLSLTKMREKLKVGETINVCDECKKMIDENEDVP